MKHVAPPIGLVETPRGVLVSLPPRLALVVSLRRTFRRVTAAAEPWTYLVSGKATRRLGAWIAEVELQALAARRRAWLASDAEWNGKTAPPPPPVPAIVTLPKKRTARPVLDLLQDMARGERLGLSYAGGSLVFRLVPSGWRIPPAIAARAIAERLIVPSGDGLFGPEWSQTWRSPTQEETDAAKDASRDRGAAGGAKRPRDRRPSPPGAQERRPRRNPRPRQAPGEGVAHAAGGKLPGRGRAGGKALT